MCSQNKQRKHAARAKAAKASTSPAKHFAENEKPSPFPHMQQKAIWMIPKRTKKGWYLKGNNNPTKRVERGNKVVAQIAAQVAAQVAA